MHAVEINLFLGNIAHLYYIFQEEIKQIFPKNLFGFKNFMKGMTFAISRLKFWGATI